MWRFYHGSDGKPGHSFDDFDRRVMMCACLFLASGGPRSTWNTKNENALFRLRGHSVHTVCEHPAHSAQRWQQRRQQLVKAELYLIAAILGFDFSYNPPHTAFLAVLGAVTDEHGGGAGEGTAQLLGTRGLPWCIAG
eukprot:gene50745-37612_t